MWISYTLKDSASLPWTVIFMLNDLMTLEAVSNLGFVFGLNTS